MTTIEQIKQHNAEAGQFFFSESTMQFFDSYVLDGVHEGPGGIYIVTTEQKPLFDGETRRQPRHYKVRQCNPDNGHVWTADPHEYGSHTEAEENAEALAHPAS